MKTCPKCNIKKELSEFPRRNGGKDGVRNRCKVCTDSYQKSHKLSRKDFYDKYWRDYIRTRKANDINFKLKCFIRKTVFRSIFTKTKSARLELGCSIPDLKTYLEAQFKDGMTWKNHGTWHIDHIYPLSKFDLSDPEQFSKACHYTNLQPLWARDNIVKGNSIPDV